MTKARLQRFIQDPQTLLNAADEYFKLCTANPIVLTDLEDEDLEKTYYNNPRVFHKKGLALHCGVKNWTEIANLRNVSSDLSDIIDLIETTIEEQNYDLAATGVFSTTVFYIDSIKAADTDIKPASSLDVSKLTTEELRAIAKARYSINI